MITQDHRLVVVVAILACLVSFPAANMVVTSALHLADPVVAVMITQDQRLVDLAVDLAILAHLVSSPAANTVVTSALHLADLVVAVMSI